MARRTTVIAGAALVAAGAAAALSTADASAAPRIHTQHFHARATAQLATGKTSFVLAEQDVIGARVIGHDVLFCSATRTHSTCHIAFAQGGGLIYARFLLRDSDHTARGRVTGGTGQYSHAHGTITARLLSPTDVVVDLRYRD
ncbi:hypothetical protein [Allobranchiibius sp. CTAmp26]|uniref:hypothetical protein n=1 Tax=Allobranchiibius sp. CTAmp26 TaxID=2815214 RepID=UPI001AA0CD34|nr:hypothetical protein [Allobranchiibius sp. CTAmp26]MBO1754391.1 hypothetical protein [Allobranchiibius sp. CTAmp26]